MAVGRWGVLRNGCVTATTDRPEVRSTRRRTCKHRIDAAAVGQWFVLVDFQTFLGGFRLPSRSFRAIFVRLLRIFRERLRQVRDCACFRYRFKSHSASPTSTRSHRRDRSISGWRPAWRRGTCPLGPLATRCSVRRRHFPLLTTPCNKAIVGALPRHPPGEEVRNEARERLSRRRVRGARAAGSPRRRSRWWPWQWRRSRAVGWSVARPDGFDIPGFADRPAVEHSGTSSQLECLMGMRIPRSPVCCGHTGETRASARARHRPPRRGSVAAGRRTPSPPSAGRSSRAESPPPPGSRGTLGSAPTLGS